MKKVNCTFKSITLYLKLSLPLKKKMFLSLKHRDKSTIRSSCLRRIKKKKTYLFFVVESLTEGHKHFLESQNVSGDGREAGQLHVSQRKHLPGHSVPLLPGAHVLSWVASPAGGSIILNTSLITDLLNLLPKSLSFGCEYTSELISSIMTPSLLN